MENNVELSQLIKKIMDNKKLLVNISKITENDLVELLNLCSLDAFNLFIMMNDGNIGVITDIKDPRNINLDNDDIAAYSNVFIMNDSIMGVSKDSASISKLLSVIKTAFKNKEKGFSVVKK